MYKKLIVVFFVFFCAISVLGQNLTDREKIGLRDYVKSVSEKTIHFENRKNKRVKSKEINRSVLYFDISGKLLSQSSAQNDSERDSNSKIKKKKLADENSPIETILVFDEENKISRIVSIFKDSRGNTKEKFVYLPEGSIEKATRFIYKYDKKGNPVKITEFTLQKINGKKSFFKKSEISRKIKYFKKKEVKNYEKQKREAKTSIPKVENPELKNSQKEEYAVYEELFKPWIEDSEIKQIVLENKTDFERLGDDLGSGFFADLGISKEVSENFISKNKSAKNKILNNFFSKKSKVVLIPEEKVEAFFVNDKGWDKFYKKYKKSQGITTVSRVGFNKDKTKALVYYGTQSNFLAGAGYLVFLEKTDEKWKLKKQQIIWIS